MNKVLIWALLIVLTVGLVISLYIWVIRESEVIDVQTKKEYPITEESVLALEQAEYVSVQKVERELIEDAEGNFDCNYYTYVVSDFMLVGANPVVDDYSLALEGKGFDQNLIRSINFKDAFGFEYKGENAWKLFQEMIYAHGIDGDITNVRFDEELYARTKQKQYVLNEPCSITKELLGDNYEVILEERVHYELATLKSGAEVPDCFLVTVKYKEGNQVITKTLYLQVGVLEWEAGVDETN